MILFYIQLAVSIFNLLLSGVYLGTIVVALTYEGNFELVWNQFAWFFFCLTLGLYLLYNCIVFLIEKCA